MTKRQILSTLRRRGPMYLMELGGSGWPLYELQQQGLVACHPRPSDRGLVSPKYLYEITPKGEAWLDEHRGLMAGIRNGLELPVTIWRRIFK